MNAHIFLRLDVARGLCAIVVFVAHIFQMFVVRLIGLEHPASQIIPTLARHAVLIFFLISGYLITRSIMSNVSRNDSFDAIDYLASRVARIYPPLIAAIVIMGVGWCVINFADLPGSPELEYGLAGDLYRSRTHFEFPIREILTSLTMRGGLLIGNGPLWSLYIEFQIYLTAMGVAMMLATTSPCRQAFGGIIVFVALKIGLTSNSDFLFFGFIWFLGAFISIVPVNESYLGKFLICCFLIVLTACIYDPNLLSSRMDTRPGQLLQIVCCIFYAKFLFATSPIKNRILVVSAKTGDFSYSLYVMHFPLILLALSLTQNWIGHSPLKTSVVCLLVAVAILAIVIGVAKVTEQTGRFKGWILFFAERTALRRPGSA